VSDRRPPLAVVFLLAANKEGLTRSLLKEASRVDTAGA